TARAAPDPAAQLVQLREPEPLGMLDHHHGRFWHVDADLDHGGGDQEPGLASGEPFHRAVLVGALHAAVHEVDAGAEAALEVGEAFLRRREVDVLGILDQRADPIDPAALGQRPPDGADDILEPSEWYSTRVDWLAAGGLLAQLRYVHVAEIRQ